MGVLIEAVCAIVRRDAIVERVSGGWEAFVEAVPTGAFCFDQEIASVGFMAVEDAQTFLAHLKALGLRIEAGSADSDACIVEQLGRWGTPAPWLGTTRLTLEEIGGEVVMAFLKGTRESHVAMPAGWKFEGSISQSPLHFQQVDSGRLRHLRNQDNVEVYWDEDLQREVYVGRPYGTRPGGQQLLSDAQRVELDRLWNDARGVIEEDKLYTRVPPFKPGFFVARKMRKAVDQLDKVIALQPAHATAFWMQGKLLQLLGDFEASLDRLAKACLLDPNVADFAREAGISATEAGKLDVAVYYAQEALKASPQDAGSRTNLAIAHLFAGNVSAAAKEIEVARTAEPDDAITFSVWVLVREVAAGRMRRPTKTSEIDSKALKEASRSARA